ncbi:hypothetical protein LTR56_011016 [Elasticomyces elasticus]|nr:hypothetical protein LTR22_019602 [Elasticomyces elasticus]KAK3641915.1 hypothetical protein LTR56_011016 [Elasticomyces elasticus]
MAAMLRRALPRLSFTSYPRTIVTQVARVSNTNYSEGRHMKLPSRSFALHGSAHGMPKEQRTPASLLELPAYSILELVCYVNKPSTIEAAKSIEQEIRSALEIFSDPSAEIVAEQGWDVPEHRHPNTTLRKVGEQDLLTPWCQPLVCDLTNGCPACELMRRRICVRSGIPDQSHLHPVVSTFTVWAKVDPYCIEEPGLMLKPNKGIRVITLRNQPVFMSLDAAEPDTSTKDIPAEPPRPPGYRVVRITCFVDRPSASEAIKSVEEHMKECVDRVSDMATQVGYSHMAPIATLLTRRQFIHGEGWDLPQYVVPVALVHGGGKHIFKVWSSPPLCYEGETCASCDAFAGGVCVGPYRCSQDTTMRTFTLYAMMEMSKAAVAGLMADVERNPNVRGVMFREETEFPSMEGAKPMGELAGLRRVG